MFRTLIAEGWVGGWQCGAVYREVEKGYVGKPRGGWKHSYVGPFEEKKKTELFEVLPRMELGR